MLFEGAVISPEMIDHINHNEHKVGDVVYYVTWSQNAKPIKIVRFGTVLENYTNSLCVQLYAAYDRRRIDGIPFNEFPDITDFKKLPKKWSYTKELFTQTEDELPGDAMFDIKDPEDIKRVINAGYLIPFQDRDYRHIDVDIQKGVYRLMKKTNNFDNHDFYNPCSRSPYISLDLAEALSTFAEAKAWVDDYYAELKRVCNLTDEEYTKEEIIHVTDRWANIYCIPEDEKRKVVSFLLSRDNLGDIEVRMCNGDVQWKYWKKKRWMSVLSKL